MKTPLSVLDLATVTQGHTSADALAGSVRLVQAAEQLGYRRFWVAEHHNMPAVASTSPPVLVGALAARTERIRVGSGGVMLPNHPPYVVAEQFATLEALYPERIDLGIGRAPGTDQRTALALRRQENPLSVEDFPQQLLELMAWMGDVRLAEPLAASLAATPAATSHPEIWLLGSSDYAARLAGVLGLRYCYAHHFGTLDPAMVLGLYREHFRPSPVLAEPHAMLCTSALVADTAEEAQYLAGPAKVMALSLRSGQLGPVISPEDAASRGFSDLEEEMLAHLPATKFVGTADDVTASLDGLVQRSGAQELMLAGTAYDVQTRIQTLAAVAQAS